MQPHSQAFARPLEDVDFDASIKALESSTVAIDEQCAILEAQLEAMKKLQAQNARPSRSDPPVDSAKQARAAFDSSDKLSDSLEAQLFSLRRQAGNDMGSIETASQRQLEKDDRLLDGLQKLMTRLGRPEAQETQYSEIEDLCGALRSLQNLVVKNQANRTYSVALKQAQDKSGLDGPELQPNEDLEVAALTEELNSLIEEVDSVLGMAIDHQYRQPYIDSLKQQEAETRRERQQWLTYVHTALQQMTNRLRDLSHYAYDLNAYGSALQAASDALDKAIVPTQTAKPPQSTTVHRATHKAIRDLVLPASSGPTHPALELLRHHGIRVNSSSGNENEARATALDAALEERKTRLLGLSRSTEQSIFSQVSDVLDHADAQSQGLIQAAHAYSPYATVNLTDRDIKDRLNRLDKELEGLGDQLRGIDLGQLTEREREHLEAVLRRQI